MACGDSTNPQYMTFSKSRIPIIGALIDYIDTSVEYLWTKTFAHAEEIYLQKSKATLSVSFIVFVCMTLGLISNVKLEIVTVDQKPLANDLHVILLSDHYKLYVDEIDVSKVLCCIEASDALLILLSCFLIWGSSTMRSPNREYMFLPWLGATLRGLICRQVPTCAVLLYTMFVAKEHINSLFLTSFALLFFVELRLWMQIVRLVCMRFMTDEQARISEMECEVQTVWNNNVVPSIEVSNYIY